MKQLFKLSMFALIVVLFASCGDDEDNTVDPTVPKSSFPLVLMTQSSGSIDGFLTAFDELPEGDVDPTNRFNSQDVASSQGMVTFGNSIFARDFESNDGVLRYDIEDDGSITTGSFIDGGQRMKVHVVSETKGYYADLEQFNIQIFNPETMQRTGEVDMSAADQGEEVRNLRNRRAHLEVGRIQRQDRAGADGGRT